MPPSTAFRLSLAANLLLAGSLALALARPRIAAGRAVATPAAASPRPATKRGATSHVGVATVFAPPKLTPAAIAELERMGIPRDTLVEVVLHDLNRRSTQHIADLQKQYAPKLVPDRVMLEVTRQTEIQRVLELRQALGEDGYRAWDKQQALRELNEGRALGDALPMSAEEAEQAYRLQKEFAEKTHAIQMAMEDGIADKADAAALQMHAQQARDRELQKLLGPDRFHALRPATDPVTAVYQNFGDLNPTPDQAQAVLQADGDYYAEEAALVHRLAENPAGATNVTSELQAMAEAREQTYRQTFGPDAYEKYKVEHDPTYETLKQYANAWNLDPDEVRQVYQSVSTFQTEANRLRRAATLNREAGQKVDWDAVNAAIKRAQQQTEAALQATIGPNRLRRLRQNGVL